jgi:hypothetical protein
LTRFQYQVVGAVVVALVSACPVRGQPTTLYVLGEIQRTCGEYIVASDAERKERPGFARATTMFTREYYAFVVLTDGFLSGANVADPTHKSAGRRTDAPSRMAWLEDYCRKKPLAGFAEALMDMRQDLIAQGK